MGMMEDLGDYLESHGIGTQGVDLFLGRFPETPDACVMVRQSGGGYYVQTMGASLSHPKVEKLTAHISVRASSIVDAEVKTKSITDVLHYFSGTINATLYLLIQLAYPPGPTGRDENDRELYSLTFDVMKAVAP